MSRLTTIQFISLGDNQLEGEGTCASLLHSYYVFRFSLRVPGRPSSSCRMGSKQLEGRLPRC